MADSLSQSWADLRRHMVHVDEEMFVHKSQNENETINQSDETSLGRYVGA